MIISPSNLSIGIGIYRTPTQVSQIPDPRIIRMKQENRRILPQCPCHLTRHDLLQCKAFLVDANGRCSAAGVSDYKICGQPVEAHPWDYNSKFQSEILDFYEVVLYF
jgi:hypothetical protein